jgi:long-chain acyl-CoA synthetase
VLSGAPTMYAALAAVPEGTAADMRTVRLAVSGASRLSPEVAAAFEAKYGIPIFEGYGLTEASPVVTSSVLAQAPKPGSIGVPLGGVEIRIVDDEGEDALEGDPGELWVRGPNVFAGYWHDEQATAAALTPDGWLRTGDMAVAGADGEIYLVDRAKDIIIVNGFNVVPAEVEDAILEFPGIVAVAVVAAEDERTGERVEAYVVPAEGADISLDTLRAHLLTRLARYKCPTEISLVPSLPYGMGGKLLRRELRRSKR